MYIYLYISIFSLKRKWRVVCVSVEMYNNNCISGAVGVLVCHKLCDVIKLELPYIIKHVIILKKVSSLAFYNNYNASQGL